MAADMLVAYYSKGCDSAKLFMGRKTGFDKSFGTHLNQHNVIRLDIQQFLFQESHLDIFLDKIQEAVIKKLQTEYKGCFETDQYRLPGVLRQIYAHTGEGFIFIIYEYSMIDSKNLWEYFGFTVDEVQTLSKQYDVNYAEIEKWYDGYLIGSHHIYNPKSVADVLM